MQIDLSPRWKLTDRYSRNRERRKAGFKIAHLKGAEALGAKRSGNTIRFQNSEKENISIPTDNAK